jgi:Arc/MetJ family transcription regulator
MVTTKRTLDLGNLLSEDSTFYGDLFAHVVLWRGTFYLEDGLHRAVRAALYQRHMLHVRVLDLDELGLDRPADTDLALTSEMPVVEV